MATLDTAAVPPSKAGIAYDSSKPTKLRSYFELTRLHKFPLGNILVIWPCLWGVTMAAYAINLPKDAFFVEIAMFTIGGTLLHSAACVINDICDIEFDRQVERTKHRPLASGALPVSGAVVLCTLLTLASSSMLLLTNYEAAKLGLIGVFPLHALYPLMKRWTYWPQAWLGLAMNWGLPVAWITVTERRDSFNVWIFFVGAAFWTLVYDTIYACQDRQDDIKAGVKSTAVLFGDAVRPILAVFASIFVACMALAGYINSQGLPFYLISCGGTIVHFIWQLSTWQVNKPEDCGAKFKANGDLGYIIWAGLLIDYYFKVAP